MKEEQDDIHRLMEVMGQDTPLAPGWPSDDVVNLRRDLIAEEVMETLDAMRDRNLPETIDGLVDSIVVILGTAVALGVNLEPFWDEVHRSNLSKLGEDGKPILRGDGKFLKGPNYSPPNIQQMLEKYSNSPREMWHYKRYWPGQEVTPDEDLTDRNLATLRMMKEVG